MAENKLCKIIAQKVGAADDLRIAVNEKSRNDILANDFAKRLGCLSGQAQPGELSNFGHKVEVLFNIHRSRLESNQAARSPSPKKMTKLIIRFFQEPFSQ